MSLNVETACLLKKKKKKTEEPILQVHAQREKAYWLVENVNIN